MGVITAMMLYGCCQSTPPYSYSSERRTRVEWRRQDDVPFLNGRGLRPPTTLLFNFISGRFSGYYGAFRPFYPLLHQTSSQNKAFARTNYTMSDRRVVVSPVFRDIFALDERYTCTPNPQLAQSTVQNCWSITLEHSSTGASLDSPTTLRT